MLHLYAPDFEGWERSRARKRSAPDSATYQTLQPDNSYAFAVVAIDNRRDHDPILLRGRNVLAFSVLPDAGPDLTFEGPFGSVTRPTDPVVVPAGEPVTVHWFATPRAGMVIEGYRSSIDQWPPDDEPSLADTMATISPPASGVTRLLYVGVQYDQGLRSLHILQPSFTGTLGDHPLASPGSRAVTRPAPAGPEGGAWIRSCRVSADQSLGRGTSGGNGRSTSEIGPGAWTARRVNPAVSSGG